METDLAVTVFRSTSQGLELTENGSLLAQHVERGLSTIQTRLEGIASRVGSARVALLPMFVSRWLSSRLGSFLESSPDLQVSIQNHDNSDARMATPEGFADLEIQWGCVNRENFKVTRLWLEELVVVCSPDYQKANPIRRPSDPNRCSLLQVDDTRMQEEWLTAYRLQLSQSQPQMMLDDRHFQLSSMINSPGS